MNPENDDLPERNPFTPKMLDQAILRNLQNPSPIGQLLQTTDVLNSNPSASGFSGTEWLKYEEVPSFTYNEWKWMHDELSNELDQSSRLDGKFGPAVMVSTVVASNLLAAVEQALGIQKGAAFRPPKDKPRFSMDRIFQALSQASGVYDQSRSDRALRERLRKYTRPWAENVPMVQNPDFLTGALLVLHELEILSRGGATDLKIP